MSSPAAAIIFDQVGFRTSGGKTLLADLSLDIPQGETLVLLGRSGCGKTTTMRLVNRILVPTSGQVRVEGRATTDWDPIRLRRRIGYVIQDAGLFPHYTVGANVGLVPQLEGWSAPDVRARVRELLELVGLPADAFEARYPGELSGGQRQRVGIARALAADPPVLLLDEPFSALDPITRRSLQLEFRALQARLGKTMVFVTHDVREALLLANRICLMREGRVVLLGTPAEFMASSDPEARAFAACLEEPSAP